MYLTSCISYHIFDIKYIISYNSHHLFDTEYLPIYNIHYPYYFKKNLLISVEKNLNMSASIFGKKCYLVYKPCVYLMT